MYGQVVVAVTPFASVTWMENEPAAVGVPVTAPVAVFSVNPAGSVPTIENVYGVVPPVTVSRSAVEWRAYFTCGPGRQAGQLRSTNNRVRTSGSGCHSLGIRDLDREGTSRSWGARNCARRCVQA